MSAATQAADWRTLPAGQELDLAVAERVLGWERATDPASSDAYLLSPQWCAAIRAGNVTGMRVGIRLGDDGKPHRVPSVVAGYSTEIDDAWKVVEAMRCRARVLDLVDRRSRGMWAARFGVEFKQAPGWSEANTAPLAICRAALAALAGPAL